MPGTPDLLPAVMRMEPSSRTAPVLAPGDVIAGKFRLERVIGRGGMGSVWAARHVQLEMPVALKFIEAEGSAVDGGDARLRFEREARAAGQIRSPHVVQILDHGIDGDRPYIAMELLEGEDLGQRLRREKRISVPACARILTQAAKALRRAHEAGIVHRDLKPGNVFLARFDDDEVVKVLDFGVAKMRRAGAIEEPQATQVGIVFGSPSYMSPEQARGARTLDHRSDLWSLAVIVYRAVTGVKPFHGATIADLVIQLCIDPLPVATRAAPDLPPEIDRFFERAFARDPEQRFASAPEMAAAFEAVAAGAAGVTPPSISSAVPPLPPEQLAAPVPAPPPEPTSTFPLGATPPSGSGMNVAFAPGTLTPPPSPTEVPFRPPGPLRAGADAGVGRLLAPFRAAGASPRDPPRPAGLHPRPSASSPPVGRLRSSGPRPERRASPPAPPSARSPCSSWWCWCGRGRRPPPPRPRARPRPRRSRRTPPRRAPRALRYRPRRSAVSATAPEPAVSAPASPSGAGAVRGPQRSGKKKKPNFGY